MKAKKAKYPLRIWLGQYEKWVLVMHGGKHLRRYDRVLERFLSLFPHKKGVEQFTSLDVADYRAIRLQKGIAIATVTRELGVIYSFWKWLIEDKDLLLNNPARAFKNINYGITAVRRTQLGLADVNRLLSECTSIRDKRNVLEIMKGGSCPRGKARRNIVEAAMRVGLVGFAPYYLKLMTRTRLSRDIVQAYCDQILNTLPTETETSSNTLATVQTTALDEGAAICNGGNDLSSISGID